MEMVKFQIPRKVRGRLKSSAVGDLFDAHVGRSQEMNARFRTTLPEISDGCRAEMPLE